MQKLEKLSNLFEIVYGVNLELNKMVICDKSDPDAINFVSRTEKNNGVSAVVKRIEGIKPNPANTISVAGGGSVLASFVQPQEYYSGRDLYILIPRRTMTEVEMIFYCHCIKKNKYKYNYGRQANKTLGNLLIPSIIPDWVSKEVSLNLLVKNPLNLQLVTLDAGRFGTFKYSQLFDIVTGIGPKKKPVEFNNGKIPHISTTDLNNGVNYYLKEDNPPHQGNRITVSNDGSVGAAFYQPIPFYSSYKVNVLNPKFDLNPYIALFLCSLIRKEKYRYSYGRKWGLARMKESEIKLPVTSDGSPDWHFMESFIKSLPYSSSI